MSHVSFSTLPGTKRASYTPGDDTRVLTSDATDTSGRRLPRGTKLRGASAKRDGITTRVVWTFSVVASVLVMLGGSAHAETLVNGKVVKVTADKLVAERQLVCTYGKSRFETDAHGRQVVIMGKVCTEVSR